MKMYVLMIRSSEDKYASIVQLAYSNDVDDLLDIVSGFLSEHDDDWHYHWIVYQDEYI